MGIRIAHDPIATPIIAAYATGVGQAQERNRDKAMVMYRDYANRQHEAQQRFMQNAWANERQNREFDFRAGQAMEDREFKLDFEAGRREFDIALRDQDFAHRQQLQQGQLDWYRDRQDREFEFERDMFDQKGLAEGKLYYTPEQKMEMGRLDEAIAEAQRNPKYDDATRQRIISEAQAKKKSVRPVPRSPDERPVPIGDMFEQETVDRGGTRYGRDANGKWYELPSSNSGQLADIQKQRSDLEKEMRDKTAKMRAEMVAGKDGTPTRRYTDDEIRAYIADDFRDAMVRLNEQEKALTQAQQGQPTPAPGQAPTPAPGQAPQAADVMPEGPGWERRTTPDGKEFWYNSFDKRHREIAEQQNRDNQPPPKSMDEMSSDAAEFRAAFGRHVPPQGAAPPQQTQPAAQRGAPDGEFFDPPEIQAKYREADQALRNRYRNQPEKLKILDDIFELYRKYGYEESQWPEDVKRRGYDLMQAL